MLFEVEQKFCWNAEKLCRLQRNLGRPPFKSIVKFKNAKFQDTYFDSQHKLSDNGLWVRKRRYSGSVSLGIPHGTAEWEAKQMRHGGSQLRSTFEETKDTVRIAHLVGAHVPGRLRPVNNFGLEKLCQFETHRQTFKADSKFTVVLDSTDFGHRVSEVELMAEDTVKAHKDIDTFMEKYSWFFDRGKPKSKLTAYFEKFGYPKEDSPILWPCMNPLFF